MAGIEGISRLFITREGEPAGGASLRITEGIAQFCGTSVLPKHRRNGIQTSLVGHRLQAAKDAGCDLAVVGVLPGSKSMQNLMRQGFELLYARAVLIKETA